MAARKPAAPDPVGVIAHKIAAAMAFDLKVEITLRDTGRVVRGKVSRRWIDRNIAFDATDEMHSNLLTEINGETFRVDAIGLVKRQVR